MLRGGRTFSAESVVGSWGAFGGRPFKCVLGLCVGVRLVAFAVRD